MSRFNLNFGQSNQGQNQNPGFRRFFGDVGQENLSPALQRINGGGLGAGGFNMDFGSGSPVLGNTPTTDNFLSGAVDNFSGGEESPGFFDEGGAAMPSIALGKGLLDGFLGLEQLDLAKKTFKQNRKQFRSNFNAQAKTTNRQLRDNQRKRVSAGGGNEVAVDEYMKNNRIDTV